MSWRAWRTLQAHRPSSGPGGDRALRVELSVEKRRVDVGAASCGPSPTTAATLPPTLRIRPGHKLDLAMKNTLDEVTTCMFTDFMCRRAVTPTTYQFPTTVRAGTYWYHPHPHLTSAPQVAGGMSGILIVDGLQQYLPASLAPHHRTRHRSQGLPTPGRRDQDPESAHRRVHASHRQRPTESDHSHSSG
ncbi:multicopper oxidase domain-containing protein [Streptomyces sp. NPDC058246]|uniref:multicopper oxidase domain-containing protein n=2 Tax=Streptomyces TaxID=1883 RepID=UPI0036E7AD62